MIWKSGDLKMNFTFLPFHFYHMLLFEVIFMGRAEELR